MKELFIDYLKRIEGMSAPADAEREAGKAWKKYAEALAPHADFAQVRGAQPLLKRLGLARQVKTEAGKTWEYGPEAKKPGRKPKAE